MSKVKVTVVRKGQTLGDLRELVEVIDWIPDSAITYVKDDGNSFSVDAEWDDES